MELGDFLDCVIDVLIMFVDSLFGEIKTKLEILGLILLIFVFFFWKKYLCIFFLSKLKCAFPFPVKILFFKSKTARFCWWVWLYKWVSFACYCIFESLLGILLSSFSFLEVLVSLNGCTLKKNKKSLFRLFSV